MSHRFGAVRQANNPHSQEWIVIPRGALFDLFCQREILQNGVSEFAGRRKRDIEFCATWHLLGKPVFRSVRTN
jgi:hypothetical protein